MDFQEDRQRRLLMRALDEASIGYGALWIAYLGLGGMAAQPEMEAHIHGMRSLPPLERDLLAEAANELIDAIPPFPRATYSGQTHQGFPTGTFESSPE